MTHHAVVVVGGGPAGLAAAMSLRGHGITDVVVLEREAVAGGVPRHCGHPGFGMAEFHRPMSGPAYARAVVQRAAGIDLRTGVTVTALRPGGTVEFADRGGAARLTADRVVLATGVRERPASARLAGGDRPWGVTTSGALQRFVYLESTRPFARPVIIGTELVAFSLLLTMRHGGISPVAMLEEAPRITARRPADWIARRIFGVPVLTGTRLVAVHGRQRVEAVDIERAGRREMLTCDGVVFSGHFVPEAALLQAGHIAVDAGTGGPAIDQDGRCDDPAYFAAGNLLRPVETAGVAFAEGRRVGDAVAADLRGRRPAILRTVPIHAGGALRYVYPQRLALPLVAGEPVTLRARADREARGRLSLRVDGVEVWTSRLHALPERRLALPLAGRGLDAAERIEALLLPA